MSATKPGNPGELAVAPISTKKKKKKLGRDFVDLLVGRGVHFIACDILSYLDEISLRSCELVSKTWYSVISESKLWEQLYQKALLKTVPFQALILRKQFRMNASSFPNAKQLLFSYENLKANWRLKKFVGYGSNPRFSVSKCAMDSKRIIIASNPTIPSEIRQPSIRVINRWTWKSECSIPLENISLRRFQLYGDFVFISSYCGKIDLWDCTTNQHIKRFQESGKVWDMFFHAAHGLLISCFNVTPIDNNNEEDLDRRLDMRQQLDVSQCKVTIRRICTSTPCFETIIEKRELISHFDLHVVGLKCDANYFALILATSEHLKIQLRSIDTFQLVNYLDLHHCSPNALFDYHSGLFVTVSAQGENEKIQLWDAKTLSCKTSWLVQKSTRQIMLSSLHLIVRTASRSTNTMTVWELSVQPPETKPKMLFQLEDKNATILGFDELQIVTLAEFGSSINIKEF